MDSSWLLMALCCNRVRFEYKHYVYIDLRNVILLQVQETQLLFTTIFDTGTALLMTKFEKSIGARVLFVRRNLFFINTESIQWAMLGVHWGGHDG